MPPLYYPILFDPYVLLNPISQNCSEAMVGKFNVVINTEALNFTVTSTSTNRFNAKIIIKNDSDSTNDITIVQGENVTIDYSADLSLIIPPGGIGELKRRASTSNWDFFGYTSLAV